MEFLPQKRMIAALFEHCPAHLTLARLPTSIDRASWLDGSKIRVWVKRDDQASSIYGGGKVRKLEWILADPKFAPPRPILSVGATGSHHLLALALHLEQQQRPLHAMVFPQVQTPHVHNNFAAMVSSGAKIWPMGARVQLPWRLLAYRYWNRPNIQGRYLAAGGSNCLGCLGFVEAGIELAAQVKNNVIRQPSDIYIAAGTAGSAAGLVIGLALSGMRCHLHLVSAVEKVGFNSAIFHWKLAAVWRFMVRQNRDLGRISLSDRIEKAGLKWSIDHSQIGPGYGFPTSSSVAVVEQANQHGIELESTYTGKALAALIRDRDRNRLSRGAEVLFWNTHASIDVSRYIDPFWQERLNVDVLHQLGFGEN